MSNPASPSIRRKFSPNFLYSIISVALVLIMAGVFSLVILLGQGLITSFKEQVNVLVELNPETGTERVDSVSLYLKSQDWVKATSVEFISKDEALMELQEEFEYLMQMDLPNPLFDMIQFNVAAHILRQDSLQAIKETLLAKNEIRDVYYQEGIVEGLSKNLKDVSLIAFAVSLVLLVIATTLIYNTNKLALYSNRFIIKNMQLVGASWTHITRPYLTRSALHGILSAVLAMAALGGGLGFLYRSLPEMGSAVGEKQLFFVFLALALGGILINLLSTLYTVSRFLRMRTDDLY